ncbi:MAG: monovalent cation/H+ antiporter subunit D [Kiloniellales bacterium]
MSHLPALPVLIPLGAAVLLLVLHGIDNAGRRIVSLLSVLALAAVAAALLLSASDGTIQVYRLGDWPAPYGIVLVLDRLAALMVTLTAMLALPVVLAATSGADTRGRHFHALLQFQIAGLNGAFLTGDLFNLFVFFEILLLASYGLLLHGGGLARVRAGLAYVILNLVGSALFLIALGLLYGTLGTLNMADMATILPLVASQDQALVRTAAALLVAVFLLKAALLPLGFWLPHAYTAACLPVAVLFVIMTKVGIYALLRVSTVGFAAAPFTADLLQPWLPWLAVATIAVGTVGALAADRLSMIVANLVLISSGTLLLGVAALSVEAMTAALYYLVHTTVITAALFLLVDALSRQRGALADELEKGPRLASLVTLGAAYLLLAIAASGAPPLSGLLGKLMVMQSLAATVTAPAAWGALLVSGLVVALVLARAASAFFWEPGPAEKAGPPAGTAPPRAKGLSLALILMVAVTPVLTLAAAPIAGYARATAQELSAREAYVTAVLGMQATIERERRP